METPIHDILEEKGSEVSTIKPAQSVAEAVQLLNRKNIGAVLVVENNKLVGMFSERDVLRRVVEQELDIYRTPVSKVMTSKVIVVSPHYTVGDAMKLMTEKRCRHLPVMEGERIVGMLSAGDVTRHLAKNQEKHINELVNYISGAY